MNRQATQNSDIPLDQLSAFERVRLTWRLLHDNRVALWMKAAVPIFALVYLVMPIDLIPDFILGLGQLDDVSVIGVSIFAMTKILPKLAPRTIRAEHLAAMRNRERGTAAKPDQTVIDVPFKFVDRDTEQQTERLSSEHWGKSA